MEVAYFIRIKKVDGTYAYYAKSMCEDCGFFEDEAGDSISFSKFESVSWLVNNIKEDFLRKDFSVLEHEEKDFDLDSLEIVEFVQTKVHKV